MWEQCTVVFYAISGWSEMRYVFCRRARALATSRRPQPRWPCAFTARFLTIVLPHALASPQDESAPSTSAPTPTPAPAPLASNVSGESPAATLNILGPVQEAINGRSAMLGFVAAVVSESLTHQSIFSQIAGKVRINTSIGYAKPCCKTVRRMHSFFPTRSTPTRCTDLFAFLPLPLTLQYVDGEIVEAPFGTSTLLFFAVVLLTTMATLVPKMVHSLNVDSRSFGPFTPGLELTLGRVAQLGFAGLLIVELVKGSALLG